MSVSLINVVLKVEDQSFSRNIAFCMFSASIPFDEKPSDLFETFKDLHKNELLTKFVVTSKLNKVFTIPPGDAARLTSELVPGASVYEVL